MDSEQLGGKQPEQTPEIDQAKISRQLGATVLAQVGFEQRHKEIVKSSFDKARASGEKLSGKNSERRNLAYINRLDGMIGQYGNRIEKRLWNISAKKLIIEPNDIQESYWKSQEQILRDNGQGDIEIDPYEKQLLTEKIRQRQAESLEPWVQYLSDEHSPYSLWFKLYAWDGMSKMGIFNKENQRFDTRNKHTVAPYPKLNQAVLAKTYRAIMDAYGFSDEPRMNLDGSMAISDKPGQEILKRSSNSIIFNEIYSKILLNEKTVLPTPERTEDIHGQWIEYLPGDENGLADAAEGTPWCIADPGTGKNYLTYGSYSHDYYSDDKDGDDYESHAKFILFHLQDDETGRVSQNACASIRLNPYGEVAEISGLDEGQAVEDSLIPIVEKKVVSLPGGEHFLKGFADKKQLIALDRKMDKNEPISQAEMEFLFEIERRIITLDTYNEYDPRIKELQHHYMEDAKAAGVVSDAQEEFLSILYDDYSYLTADGFKRCHEGGANVNPLIESTRGKLSEENADRALNSENVDLALLLDKMTPESVARNFDALTKKGTEIDIDKLASRLSSEYISEHTAELLDKKVSPGVLVSRLDSKSAAKNFGLLIKAGATADDIITRLSETTVAKNAKLMVEKYNASQAVIVDKLSNEAIEKNFGFLCKKQGLDINLLVKRLAPQVIRRNMQYLADNGASGEVIASVLPTLEIIDSFDQLVNMGVKFDLAKISRELKPSDALWRLNELDRIGIKYDINELIRAADRQDVDNLADELIEHGASRSVIAEILGDKYF